MSVTVREWPNKLGHDVLLGDLEIAQVFDDPDQDGVKVLTYDADDAPDLVLEWPDKLPPLKAVALCFVMGQPAEVGRPDAEGVKELRKKHGKSAVILLDRGSDVACLDSDRKRLEQADVPCSFPRAEMAEHSHRLLCEGLKVVVVHAAQLARALGGAG